MELRGHDHVVECAVFAPVVAYPAIRELAGLNVSQYEFEFDEPGSLQNSVEANNKTTGAYVATGSRDKSIRIWETSSGQCLRTLVRHF